MAKEKTFWQKHREVIKRNLRQHAPWEQWVDAGVSTVVTLLLVWLLLHSSITGDLFSSVAEIDSPELIDLYTSTSHRSGVPKYSSILLMPIDGCSRHDVTTALEILSEMEPQAVGVDVTFPFYAEGDDRLLEAIMSNPHIVLASIPEKTDSGFQMNAQSSYFEPVLREEGVKFGSVVLDADSRYDIIRSFTPAVFSGKDTVWSLEIQLARMAGADVTRFRPYDEHSYILFSNILTDTLSAKALMAPDADWNELAEKVKDKIVLIGDLEATMDMYRTPIHSDLPGMLIHAYALDTILRGTTVKVSPAWLNWLVAFIICIGFAFLTLYFKWAYDEADDLAMRLTQIFLMIVIVVVPGIWMFSSFHWYFDFTPTFFALAIQAAVLDIWVGIMTIIMHIKEMREN